MKHSATYSPDDNKLRLYPACTLDEDERLKLREAGFRWAPRQELYVAPAWSPSREDILLEMCSEIEDEDTSLTDRAEQRAERFTEYSRKRAADANRAAEAAEEIGGRFEAGQPILVGHHSEKRARKDKERIESNMRRAIGCWSTANYWKERAAGALNAAKYKELPGVRHRRIKKLEAERRKWIAEYTPADSPPQKIMQTGWNDDEPSMHVWCGPKGRGGHWVKESSLPAIAARNARWIEHIDNRLAYERAMLDEQGGDKAEQFANVEVGGRILAKTMHGKKWLTVTKTNKSRGEVRSFSTNNDQWPRIIQVENVLEYESPSEENAKAVKAAAKPPICNYEAESVEVPNLYRRGEYITCKCRRLTKKEWAKIHRDYKHTRLVRDGSHRVRVASFELGRLEFVFLTDQKVNRRPKAAVAKPAIAPPMKAEIPAPTQRPIASEEEQRFEAMADALKNGVQAVAVPQLFETPAELADKLVRLASPHSCDRILEPSAGTGRLIQALLRNNACAQVTAIEVDSRLATTLRDRWGRGNCNVEIFCDDFLLATEGKYGGPFDVIVMNPPFANAADIQHIRHAMTLLADGGTLAAICANGPRQRDSLMAEAEHWEDLPQSSFKESGTNVRAAICVFRK